MQLTKIKSSVPVVKVLDIHQRRRPEESCDTHLICQDGYIPCHRFVLMANSSFLNHLILDNLNDIGHMDTKSIISLSFPEVKTSHMAHVISMFYTGKAVCQLKDVFYVMGIMKILGNDVSSTSAATDDEISAHYKPRYFIDAESDSEVEDTSRVTSNVFSALKLKKLATSSTVEDENHKTTKNTLESKPKSNAPEENIEIGAEKHAIPDVPMEHSTSNGHLEKSQDRNQPPMDPKVTPINIKDLMQRKTRKRARANSNKESNSKRDKGSKDMKSMESDEVASDSSSVAKSNIQGNKDKKSMDSDKTTDSSSVAKSNIQRSKDKKSMESDKSTDSTSVTQSKKSLSSERKTSNEKSEEKKKIIEESDCEFDSDDSALEIISVRKLRKRTPKSPEKREGLRSTPLRGGRKFSDGNALATIKVEPVVQQNGDDQRDSDEDSIQEVKCYFCSNIFGSEKLLGVHLSRNCGRDLSEKYSIPSKSCYVCQKDFPTLNLWGLIRHVNGCHQNKKNRLGEMKSSLHSNDAHHIQSKKNGVVTNKTSNEDKHAPAMNIEKARKKIDSENEIDSDEPISVMDSLKVRVLHSESDLMRKSNTKTTPAKVAVSERMEPDDELVTVESLMQEIQNDITEFNKQTALSRQRPRSPISSDDDDFLSDVPSGAKKFSLEAKSVAAVPSGSKKNSIEAKSVAAVPSGTKKKSIEAKSVAAVPSGTKKISLECKNVASVPSGTKNLSPDTKIVAAVPSGTKKNSVENNSKSGDCSQSSSNVVQVYQPQIPPAKNVAFNPNLVVERFRKVYNKDGQDKQNKKSCVQFDINKPSTSKAAMSYMAMLDPLPEPLTFPVPKIPALDQKSSHAKRKSEILSGDREIIETTTYIPFVRNPLPGDRLYCGTLTLENQGFRLFKTCSDSDDNRNKAGNAQMCLRSSSDGVVSQVLLKLPAEMQGEKVKS